MANRVESTLTADLYDYLQRERFLTLATVDYETGGPNVHALSWVYSPHPQCVRFAIDNRSRIVENIRMNPLVVLTLIAAESTYSINGKAFIKEEKILNIPLKLALVELEISEVRDVMFYGSKILAGPKYEKTYDLEAATKLDRQVMEALKKTVIV
ncbi:pyridoxamine 5'-phosphate oxidase family protein [Bacillus pinisoli]|uniref:pyridoxamine 5'-phosphate oxidase family protein n=1 Tax=Bacillus pinisoli TaxID=2901866 RepID=UPI001FF2061E|nr:pyridoxamine 5'-phosphate oxidase family protein [Bacillus pinisoli]